MNNFQYQNNEAAAMHLLKGKGYKLFYGIVDDLDIGLVTASMTIKSGKRILSMVLPKGDVTLSGAELNKPIFCLMKGKDVYVFRDIKYFMTSFFKNNSDYQMALGI